MAAWESSWQQMGTGGYDQRGVPKPPSRAWSERCLKAGARSNDNFKPVTYKAKDEIVQKALSSTKRGLPRSAPMRRS